MVTTELLSTITEQVVRNFHPLRVILFNSQAQGDADSGSDVDRLVVLSEMTDKHQIAIEIRRALAHLSANKDVVVTTPDEIARRGTLVGTVLRPA